MKKVILASVIAIALSGCASIQPSENVKALRDVNIAKTKVEVAQDLKAKAETLVINADARLKEAEIEYTQAKDKFEAVYQFEK